MPGVLRQAELHIPREKHARFDGDVAGQQVRVEAHIGGAAGVDVIAQAGEFSVGQRQAEVHQRVDVTAAEFRSKDDQQVGLVAERVTEVLRLHRWRQEGCILAGQKAHSAGVAVLQELNEGLLPGGCSLMPAWFAR